MSAGGVKTGGKKIKFLQQKVLLLKNCSQTDQQKIVWLVIRCGVKLNTY